MQKARAELQKALAYVVHASLLGQPDIEIAGMLQEWKKEAENREIKKTAGQVEEMLTKVVLLMEDIHAYYQLGMKKAQRKLETRNAEARKEDRLDALRRDGFKDA